MANNFSYLFNDNITNNTDIRSLVANHTANEDVRIQEMYDEYMEHLEVAKTMTLAEGLAGLSFKQVESPGGYPALVAGNGERNMLAKDTFAAINAILAIAANKYRVLDKHYHEAWFDATRDAEGIASAYIDGAWKFFDWNNGAFVPSKMSSNRRKKQERKHDAIDAVLRVQQYKHSYLIVLNKEEELSHAQTRIIDRLEMTLDKVWEEIANDYNETVQKRAFYQNGANTNTTRVLPEEVVKDREKFVKKLEKLVDPVNVTYDTPVRKGVVVLFDPSNANARDAFLRQVRNSKKDVVFVKVEPVA